MLLFVPTETRPALVAPNARAFYGLSNSPALVTFESVTAERVVLVFESGARAVEPRDIAERMAAAGTRTWLASGFAKHFPAEAADFRARLA
jgi:hypothetical protein